MIYRLILSFILITTFVIEDHLSPGGHKFTLDLTSGLNFLLSLIFTWSWILFWDLLSARLRLGRFFVPLFMALAALIHYYELNSGGKLDTSMLLDNWKGIADQSGLRLLGSLLYDHFVAANVFWSAVIAGLFSLTYLEKHSAIMERAKSFRKFFLPSPFVLVFVLSFSFPSSFEAFGGLFRGLTERVYSRPHKLKTWALEKQPTPPPVILTNHSLDKKPNIIVVFVESLSSSFVETQSPTGVEYMPVLNSLIKKGTYFEKHYSVSVQTTRGHFAALCGKIPMYQGLESQDHAKRDFDCLPKYLKKNGYTTVFMQAFGKHNFDNTNDFFLAQGFDHIPQVAKTCDQETEVPCWNWGIQDDEFYRRAFKKMKDYPSPFFLTLATITSHMPFQGTPEHLVIHFKKPKNRFENYVNTLTVVDNAFQVLLDEIKKAGIADNTVLIITGDHGFPMGQHQNFHNENYAYEENFRVPFLILDLRSPLQSGIRISSPTSHLNLSATVLDFSGYLGSTTFQAPSLLQKNFENQPIFLVQPYSGVLLGSVRWPWKFLFEERTYQEWVYNLEKDPQESHPLSLSDAPVEIQEALQNDVASIIWNNIQVLKSN